MKQSLFECVGQNQFKLKSELTLILESSNYEMLTEDNLGQWARKYLTLGLVALSIGRTLGGIPPEVTPWSQLNDAQKQEWIVKTEKAGLPAAEAEGFYQAEEVLQQGEKLKNTLEKQTQSTSAQSAAATDASAGMSGMFKKMGIVPFGELTKNEQESWAKNFGTNAPSEYQKFQLSLRQAGKNEDWLKKFDQKMSDFKKAGEAADKLLGIDVSGAKNADPSTGGKYSLPGPQKTFK